MIWIFPMAGKGTRTQQFGSFKPFIEISGRPMLGWLFASIGRKIQMQDTLAFVTTEEYARAYDVQERIERILRSAGLGQPFSLITCPQTPQGPSRSVYLARDFLDTEQPVITVNCDQFIDFDCFAYTSGRQGFLPIYANFGSQSSYVEIYDGRIVRIVEKQNISNLASAGVYGVSSGKALLRALERQFEQNQMTGQEFYVGPALNYLIEEGYDFYPTRVRVKYDLGNAEGIRMFEETAMCTLHAGVS
ncbi:MAG TPA: NTP transferase domain-containing protein [Anaerohalosphaeraceae bacterium]|nr:NTP transferase domain-containing protein [Anaerohalosphaeraceae bacterium]